MCIRTEAEYRALGIPNQSPFDWRLQPVYVPQKRKKANPDQVAARREQIKQQILRENRFVDIHAYGLSNSEKAPR